MPDIATVMRGRRLFGVAAFRGKLNELAYEASGGTCLVDGVEIPCPFYIDTEQGIVKVYDLTGVPGLPEGVQTKFGKVTVAMYKDLEATGFLTTESAQAMLASGELETDGGPWGLVTRTLRGKVELYAPATPATSAA